VTLDPVPANPPSPPALCLVDVTNGFSECPTATGTLPRAGDTMKLEPEGGYHLDSSGDPLSYTWTVLKPSETPVTFNPLTPDSGYVEFTWPQNTPLLEIQDTITNGVVNANAPPVPVKVGNKTIELPALEQATQSITAGPAPPVAALAMTNLPAGAVTPGSTVPLTAAGSIAGSATTPDGTYSLTQTSGPSAGFTPSGCTGTLNSCQFTVTVPAPNAQGNTMAFTAKLTVGSGSSESVATQQFPHRPDRQHHGGGHGG
jgi:hypothetical protein